MIFAGKLTFLGLLIANGVSCVSSLSLIPKKRDCGNGAENAFASITPSKTIHWVPCYRDTDAAQLGPITLLARFNWQSSNSVLQSPLQTGAPFSSIQEVLAETRK